MKKLSRWRNSRGLRGKKRPHQLAVRTTISMPPKVFEIAEERMKFREIPCLSKLVHFKVDPQLVAAATRAAGAWEKLRGYLQKIHHEQKKKRQRAA